MVLKKERGRRLVPKKEREWIMVSKEEKRLVPKETKISLNSKFTLFGYNILD